MPRSTVDVMQCVSERRSVRAYQAKVVPDEALAELLDAARLAPSASNRQDWRFVVTRDPGQVKRVAEAAGQAFIGTAPVVIAGVSLNPHRVMSCGVPVYPVDLAIAMTNITLVAVAWGLGTCWIGAFDQDKVRRVLGIPAEFKVVELMPLGYPADQPPRKQRKPLQEVVSYDRFQGSA